MRLRGGRPTPEGPPKSFAVSGLLLWGVRKGAWVELVGWPMAACRGDLSARLPCEETTVVPSGLSFMVVVLWVVAAAGPLPGGGRGGDPQRLNEGQSKMEWFPSHAPP